MKIKDIAYLDIKDLKNIDYATILQNLKKRPDIIIECLMITATIAACFLLYSHNKDLRQKTSQDVNSLEEKAAIYNDLLAAKNALDNLKKSFPKEISEDQFIETIAETAKHYGIIIDSFSKAQSASRETHSSISLSIKVRAASYNDLWAFVYDLEHNNATLKIDSWTFSGSQGMRRFRGGTDTANEQTAATLSISIINFKS